MAILLLASVAGVAMAGRRRDAAAAFLLVAALAGAWNGAAAGRRSELACMQDVATGESITVTGIVTNRVPTDSRARPLLRLRDASLHRRSQACQAGAVLARIQPTAAAPRLGSQVRVEGEWMRFELGGGRVTGTLESRSSLARESLLFSARRVLAARMDSRLPPDVRATALALLMAERDEMTPDARRRYAAAGMAHLLAVSGMHVGMLYLMATWCLGAVSARYRHTLALLLLVGYVLVIGAPVAARRALIVLTGYSWASGRGWPARTGELVGLAGLLIVVAEPGSLLDAGFQLSFAGFSGVLLGLRMCGPGRSRPVKAVMASSFAFLATSPITAWHFGQVTPIALISHFVAGPLVAATLGSLVFGLALPTPLWLPGAFVATGSIRLLDAIASWFASIPLGHIGVGPPGLATWAAWILLLWSAVRYLRTRQWRATATPALSVVLISVAAPLLPLLGTQPALLCTLSVGQGDAAVLRTPNGRWMVFDGGPSSRSWDAGSAIVLPFLRRHGAAHVDLAVLSHPDLDHVGGLISLLHDMSVGRVLDSGDPLPSVPYKRFLAQIDATGSLWLPAVAGDSLVLDGVRILVLAPDGTSAGFPRSANETSLIFRVEFPGGFRYLNTGDATVQEEQLLLRRWPGEVLRSDLLKVGHHGSRTSSAVQFVEAVGPSIAVISSGARNPYGHPHAETLERLEIAEVPRIWRTDRHGSLCIEIDEGGRWRVRGEGDWVVPGRSP